MNTSAAAAIFAKFAGQCQQGATAAKDDQSRGSWLAMEKFWREQAEVYEHRSRTAQQPAPANV